MKKLLSLGMIVVVALIVGCSKNTNTSEAKMTKTDSGLKYVDEVVGSGTEAAPGTMVSVNYTGWLDTNGEKGTKFDSSIDRGVPFEFPLGKGMVIKGWDEGVTGMKIGGKRVLYIPSALAYGERGAGGVIPPNSNLIFEVALLKVN